MTTSEIPRRTLLDCLAEGKLSQSVALGHAVLLAQELGRLHAAGLVHGALSPEVIVLTEAGLDLLPARSPGDITPYSAPELLAEGPCDALSDIFSFGAVVYEMLAGRRAFEGDTPQALARAIGEFQPPSCGSAALDRLIGTCLAKDRSARFQRVEKILMELRLAAIASRRSQLPPLSRWELADARLKSEMRHTVELHAASVDAMFADLKSEMQNLRESVQSHAAAIDAIRADLKHNESLVEWVVEILETMQSNLLETSRAAEAGAKHG